VSIICKDIRQAWLVWKSIK